MNLASECVFVPMSLLSLFLCARIWSQEETMTSIRNWSGERKILASPVCGVVCGPLVTLTNQTGLNITLTLWHNITPCADRQRSFACVLLLRGLLVFVFKGGEWKRLEDWVFFFRFFWASLSLFSVFRYEQCQGWSPTHISTPSSCHILSLHSCSKRPFINRSNYSMSELGT